MRLAAYEVFEKGRRITGKELHLHGERYRVLVVPPVEVIPYATLAKAKAFFAAGGVVLGYGFLPSKSATLGHGSRDIASLCAAIWGQNVVPGVSCCRTSPAGGRSYLLKEKPTCAELQQVLGDAGIHPTLEVLAGKTSGWLHVLHRVKAGQDLFLVCNQNHQAPHGRSSSGPRPPASPSVGMPCGAKSRRSPFNAPATTRWSFRSPWSRWRAY